MGKSTGYAVQVQRRERRNLMSSDERCYRVRQKRWERETIEQRGISTVKRSDLLQLLATK